MARERLNILEWLEDTIGVQYIANSGLHREAVSDCPGCGRQKKLWVNLETGAWVCFYCLRAGPSEAPLVPLYQLIHDCTRDEARRGLLDLRGPRQGSRASTTPEIEQARPEWTGALPEEYEPVYDEDGWNVPHYLLERGISALTARDYELGYCAAGRYAGRVILPIIHNDKVMGFQGRAVDAWRSPKYDQPAGMPKSKLLFGHDRVRPNADLLVVEGAFDVLGCREADLDAVAILGKTLSTDQADLLLSLKPKRIIITTDPMKVDATAPWCGVRSCDTLWNKGFRNTALLICPGEQDPADLGTSDPERFQDLVSNAKWPLERERREHHAAYDRKMKELRESVLANSQRRR